MVDGFSSADPSLARGPQVAARPRTVSGGGRRSTLDMPTPAAGELTGTAAEREAQIAAFRRGGSSALAQERAKAEQRQAAEQKKIEEMRERGRQELAKRTQQALRSKQLVDSLRAREQIRVEAEERGRGFTRTELQKRLKELGTSLQEFRQASKAAREQFKKTGVSVAQQVREEADVKRVVAPDVKVDTTFIKVPDPSAIPTVTPTQQETFVQGMNLFISPSEGSGQATGTFRQPTLEEQEKITTAQVRGSAQFLESLVLPASIINEPLIVKDKKDAERIAELLRKSKFGAAGGKESIKALEELAKISREAKDTTILAPGETITSVGEILRNINQTNTVNIGGFDVKPKTAERLLQFGVKAAEAEAAVLGFQVGGALLGAGGGGLTITGTPGQLKTLKTVSGISTGLLAPSFGALSGVRVFQETGDVGSAISAGLGTTTGFLAAAFSKNILESIKKTGTKKLPPIGKRGEVGGESEYIEVVDKNTGQVTFVKKSSLSQNQLSTLQAETSFKAASPERQVRIIKLAFEKKFKDVVFLDAATQEAELIKNINLATNFMRNAGLTDAQIKANLIKIFPKLDTTSTVVVGTTTGGVLDTTADNIFIGATKGGQVGAGFISTSLIDPEQVGQTNFLTGSNIFQDSLTDTKQDTKQKTGQLFDFGTAQDTKQEPIQLLNIDTKQDTKQKTGQLFDFGTAQDFAQDTTQDTRTIQDSLTATTLLTIPSLAQPQVNLFGEPTPQRGRRPGEPEPLIKITKPKSDSVVKRLAKKAVKGELDGWFAQVKESGKWKTINSKKPIVKKRAEQLAKKTADVTLSASARIKKANKPAQDFFRGIKTNPAKFRDFVIRAGKKIKQENFWIEKRGRRLDHPKETRDLQAFKRSSEFGRLKGKPKRKTPKKQTQPRKKTFKGGNIFFKS